MKIEKVVLHDPTESKPPVEFSGGFLFFEGRLPLPIDAAFWEKHKPQAGGYYVVYEDGYKSFSPAEAFESGYTRVGEKVELETLVRPLQEWLNANCHPHVVVIVDSEHAQLMEGVTTVQRVQRT